MTIKKLSNMPYAQAHVVVSGDTITLVSYTTTVAAIKNNWLEVYGLYSATTRRHIGAFMREYTGLGYSTAKQLYIDGMSLNIETGEVINLEDEAL